MKFKFESNQIIVFLVAFLIGIGVTSYFRSDSGGADIMESAEKDEVVEEVAEESEEATEEEAAPTPAPTTSAAPATTTTTKPSNDFVSGTCSTGLSGYKDSKLNAIVLSWSPCASDNFQFYKLVKSSKNAGPSYPSDPVAFSSSNKNAANFVDKTVAARTTYYYRMCVVQRLGAVNCSNVASVSF
jgi:hypothetical protein